jgi:CubicO group peptidase (beta-lactamase class C family)/acetyl esterase/lipase
MKNPIPILLCFWVTPLFCAGADGTLAPVIRSFVDQGIVPGAVALVADKDGVLAMEAAGYSSLEGKVPMREDAVFWIASMSKSLTGVALMMLVDEGKVSLDDPVGKYIPEFNGLEVKDADGKLRPPSHPVTVREVMNHTSGLVLASDKSLVLNQILSEDVLQYAKQPLRQDPGTKYEYNNCGINTGGRIIEVASGLDYADFMQQRLFGPLGMVDTTCWPDACQAARLAHTARRTTDGGLEEITQDANAKPEHILKFSGGVPVPAAVTKDMGFGIAFEYGKRYAMPAGGYFSTARDLGQFCRMLLRGGELDGKRYLSEKAVRELASDRLGGASFGKQEEYGVGFSVNLTDEEGPSPGSFGHRGARRTAMWIDPISGLAMVILVERFDMPGAEQKTMYGGFMKAAVREFGAKPKPKAPEPIYADIPFGPHPHQLLDIYLPASGKAPYPAVLWFGGIWKAAKHPANLGFFGSKGIAVVAVQVRSMEDAMAEKEPVPVSYVQSDAIRSVQFVRHHAAQWSIDPARLATGGGSQGAQPALFAGCSRDWADPSSDDPVLRESSLVTCVAAYRCQPTFDPQRMQDWVAGVKWGAPAFGVHFEESLARREEFLPMIRKWSPDYLLHKGAAPMFFENEWGLEKPADITQTNYDVHSPAWALGFQEFAKSAGAECHVRFPGHPADDPAKDIWDFVARRLLAGKD